MPSKANTYGAIASGSVIGGVTGIICAAAAAPVVLPTIGVAAAFSALFWGAAKYGESPKK